MSSSSIRDVFFSSDGSSRVVRGASINSGSARLAELAVRVGFEIVWVEMEHGPTDFAAAESICQAAEAAGGWASIRVPDGQRCHVLGALEVGARIVVVPMVNTVDQARQVVQFGKFPPIGQRGFSSRSRGVGFGIGDKLAAFAKANASTHLLVQIETAEAVANLDAICGVEGLSGILIGPGDLSVSLGCAGNLSSPKLIEAVVDCIRRACAAGKHAGIMTGPGPLLEAARNAGCDLCYVASDVTDLIPAWQRLLGQVPPRLVP